MDKTPVSVTLDDLEATAKDAKNGVVLCGPRYLKVYWDDATNSFSYWRKSMPIGRKAAEGFMK